MKSKYIYNMQEYVENMIDIICSFRNITVAYFKQCNKNFSMVDIEKEFKLVTGTNYSNYTGNIIKF